jgi:predicted DNA-binding transcriptional regulator AlpA
MAERPVITRAQVAELLGMAPATLLDRIGHMRQHHAFPHAIPGSGGRRYSRAAVLAWIERRPTPPPNPALEQDVAECEAILLGRARAMAAG